MIVFLVIAGALALTGCTPTSFDMADFGEDCKPHGGLERVQAHAAGGWTTDGEAYCQDGTIIFYRGWNKDVVPAQPQPQP